MNFHVVRSSAGSGKTYTLVKNYLLFLFKGNAPNFYKHILAITFTNKSTNEMKERILEALEGISESSDKYAILGKELSVLTGIEHHDLKIKASQILKSLIHEYGDFNVSTIDKFVYKIVKSFSYEMNISVNVEIELKEERLIQRMVDALFNSISKDKKLARVLLDFSHFKMINGQNYDLEKDLYDLCREVINSKSEQYLKHFQQFSLEQFLEARMKLLTKAKEIESNIKRIAKQTLNLLLINGLDINDLYYGKSGFYAYLNNMASDPPIPANPNSHVIKTLDEDKWTSPKCSPEAKAKLETIKTDLRSGLVELIDFIQNNKETYTFSRVMSRQIHTMAIVNEVNREYQKVKEAFNIIRLDDFNRIIAKIISENPIPYIYERLGEKFHHYLIDEFQDTSSIQWFNLVPLLENALSSGYDSLVVGDAKQAIYRWRGGELDQLNTLPEFNFKDVPVADTEVDSTLMKETYKPEVLENNFRSSTQVVNFINLFLDELKRIYPLEMSKVYSDHHQKRASQIDHGSVEIQFLNNDDFDAQNLQLIVDRIKNCYELDYAFSDMAVLCRKTDQCSAVADMLQNNDIPFVSAESMKLMHSDKVKFISNWFLYLFDGKSDRHAFAIIEFLVKSEGIVKMDQDTMIQWWKENRSLPKFLEAFNVDINIDLLVRENLLEITGILIESCIGPTGHDAYLVCIEDYIAGFISKFGNDQMEFINWWKERADDLVVEYPASKDAVNVMTIHKAKGLEFDVVIVPFVCGDIKAGKSYLWVETTDEDKEMMPYAMMPVTKKMEDSRYKGDYESEMRASFIDTMNVIYVALTRAKIHLTVFSKIPGKSLSERKEEKIMFHAMSLKELNETDEVYAFRVGEILKNQDKKKKSIPQTLSYAFHEVIPWKKRLMLKYRSDHLDSNFDDLQANEIGLMYHQILGEMSDMDELDHILDKYLAQNLLNKAQAEGIKVILNTCFKKPEIAPYFYKVQGSVFNERDILSKNGKLFRPDRCIVQNDQIILIDYKTGKMDPKHDLQMKNYLNLVLELGYASCKAVLVYITESKIKEVA